MSNRSRGETGHYGSVLINSPEESPRHNVGNPGESPHHDVNNPGDTPRRDVENPRESPRHELDNHGDSPRYGVENPRESQRHDVNNPSESQNNDVNNPGDSTRHNVESPGESESTDVDRAASFPVHIQIVKQKKQVYKPKIDIASHDQSHDQIPDSSKNETDRSKNQEKQMNTKDKTLEERLAAFTRKAKELLSLLRLPLIEWKGLLAVNKFYNFLPYLPEKKLQEIMYYQMGKYLFVGEHINKEAKKCNKWMGRIFLYESNRFACLKFITVPLLLFKNCYNKI